MDRISRLGALALFCAQAAATADPGVGLSPVGVVRLVEPAGGGAGPQHEDAFARVLESGDFDGDGRDDLAVGSPFDSGPLAAPISGAGSVVVYPGVARGTLDVEDPERLDLRPEFRGPFQNYGHALAACDFNGDSFDELAVGAPGVSISTFPDAGLVYVFNGHPNGLDADDREVLSQSSPSIPDEPESGDRFGAALACGDFNGDGFADLAIGAPGETLSGAPAAGWIVLIPGSSDGLRVAGSVAYSQQGALPSEPESQDRFGAALAAGDLDGDGADDLAVGVPGEDLEAGAVHVLLGGADPGAIHTLLHDEALGGLSEPGDRFGLSLAFGDFDADSFDELVVGIPHETFANAGGQVPQTGQVVVVYGSSAFPTLGRIEYWAENNIFAPGTSEPFDRFGSALATGDFDGDGFDDLAAGHPGEAPATAPGDANHGAVTAFVGSAGGLTNSGRRRFVPSEEGVPGLPSAASTGEFGRALAAGDFDGDGFADLAVGSPFETVQGFDDAGAATVLRGALFADGFESGDDARWAPFPE